MANRCYGALFILSVAFFIATLDSKSYQGYVERRNINLKHEYLNLKHRGTVKTIESIDHEDVIDCVDIYKQPAFDHPLVNDLQIEPTSYPSGILIENNVSHPELFQSWRRNGECPEGTIPIRRAQNHDNYTHRNLKLVLHQKRINASYQSQNNHEYATVKQDGSNIHGARAHINVWNPRTEPNEFSVSQIWIESDYGDISTLNTIEVGWTVYPGRYRDSRTRFFIFWTANGYQTGCYDLSCPGFLQTDRRFAIGAPIEPISTYGGHPYDISINVYKDKNTGNWWLQLQGVTLGYWPKTIFSTLADGAKSVVWGGEIANFRPEGHHTPTQMGSGHFSSEGFGKSSFFMQLGVVDSTDALVEPNSLLPLSSNPACYDLAIQPKKPNFDTHFYYGGPGFSPTCG